MFDYSNGCLADHWSSKGHIVPCLEGALVSEMEEGSELLYRKERPILFQME